MRSLQRRRRTQTLSSEFAALGRPCQRVRQHGGAAQHDRRQRQSDRVEHRRARRAGEHRRPRAFQGPSAEPRATTLFISKPVLGRASGKWSVQLSRGYRDRTAISPASSWCRSAADKLSAFYQSIDLGPDGGDPAGRARRRGARERRASRSTRSAGSIPSRQLLQRAAVAPEGQFTTRGGLDGVARDHVLSRARRLSAGDFGRAGRASRVRRLLAQPDTSTAPSRRP